MVLEGSKVWTGGSVPLPTLSCHAQNCRRAELLRSVLKTRMLVVRARVVTPCQS